MPNGTKDSRMIRLPFNPSLAELPVYQPGRPIEEVARELGADPNDILKLASNENPLGPGKKAVSALKDLASKAHLYPDGGCFALRNALSARLKVQGEQLIFGNGSNEIIEFLGHALLEPGANIVVSQYCFAIYPIVAKMFGAEVKMVPAVDYGSDLDAMAEAIDSNTRIVFVANPNNPTGTLSASDRLEAMVDAIPETTLMVVDEAYVEYLERPPALLDRIREGRENLLLMRTFSKIHGLAALRLGYGVGHAEFVAALERVRQPFNVNAFAQAAAVAALDDEAHVVRTRELNAAELETLSLAMRDRKLEFVPSHANFLLIKVGEGAQVAAALQKRGVIVRPVGGYGLPEWIRVTVGTREENEIFLSSLDEILGIYLD